MRGAVIWLSGAWRPTASHVFAQARRNPERRTWAEFVHVLRATEDHVEIGAREPVIGLSPAAIARMSPVTSSRQCTSPVRCHSIIQFMA